MVGEKKVLHTYMDTVIWVKWIYTASYRFGFGQSKIYVYQNVWGLWKWICIVRFIRDYYCASSNVYINPFVSGLMYGHVIWSAATLTFYWRFFVFFFVPNVPRRPASEKKSQTAYDHPVMSAMLRFRSSVCRSVEPLGVDKTAAIKVAALMHAQQSIQ